MLGVSALVQRKAASCWELLRTSNRHAVMATLRHPVDTGVSHVQVQEHYDTGDGLHIIDIAMLPQQGIPSWIAVEADGSSHFLYEDYRLQFGPATATR